MLVTASPMRVQPLSKSVFNKAVRQETLAKLLKRYSKGKDDVNYLKDIEVCSYYESRSKTRIFYSISDDLQLDYYSQLSLADSRGFFDSKFKIYYQSLVWASPALRAKHRGFARSVIYEIFPQYVDTVLITDRLQTDNGFYMWKNIIYEAINHGFSSIAYCYDKRLKKRYLCRLTQADISQYSDDLDILFGDYEYHENRGFLITKKTLAQYMIKDIKVTSLSIEDFIAAVDDLDQAQ